jgi:hypothetical protein
MDEALHTRISWHLASPACREDMTGLPAPAALQISPESWQALEDTCGTIPLEKKKR